MGIISTVFRDDIVLDQEAFSKASKDLAVLSKRLEDLDREIGEMMSELERGFNTPAGRKLVKACKNNLSKPMKDQKAVLKHISTTLTDVQNMYAALFREFEGLNKALSGFNND